MEEKIKRLKELIKEIDKIESLVCNKGDKMNEDNEIDLFMLKSEIFEILRTL